MPIPYYSINHSNSYNTRHSSHKKEGISHRDDVLFQTKNLIFNYYFVILTTNPPPGAMCKFNFLLADTRITSRL